jgi:hypothetical protein
MFLFFGRDPYGAPDDGDCGRGSLIRRNSIFNEGIDTDTRGRWRSRVADRLPSSVTAIEVGVHLIFKLCTMLMKWGLLRVPGDTTGAYNGSAIGLYCPIELIPICCPPVPLSRAGSHLLLSRGNV